MLEITILLTGIVLLIAGTRIAIANSMLIAAHYRLSDFFVGVVILSAGSDLPEIVVTVSASIHQFYGTDTSGLIIGNVLGSNFTQIGLIMGLSGIYSYLTLTRQHIFLHGGMLLGSILFLMLAALDGYINRIEGAILLIAFFIYGVMLFEEEMRTEKPVQGKAVNIYRTWFFLFAGLLLVIAGSEITVSFTVKLAETLGISQTIIALVIVGIGSSLPELAISIGAAVKARGGMSVGNLIGSNILDTLLPAGLAGMIHPFRVDLKVSGIDLPILFLYSALILALFIRQRGLQKKEAAGILVIYCIYIFYKLSGY